MLQALRLHEYLMPLFVREANYFVFYGWTVARTGRVNLSRVHRRAVQIRSDQLMRRGARVSQMTKHLRQRDPIGENRKRPRDIVTRRGLQLREIHAVLPDARRRTSRQSA